MNSIKVLDHGFVRLVSYMQPADSHMTVVHNDKWTGDLEIVRNARVSFDADWRTGEDEGKDERLIHRMMEGRHSSPFESMVFTFEVKAPIFVFRQWHRHRTWSYNEVSARYAELPEEFYVPEPQQVGVQSKNNKQARELPGFHEGSDLLHAEISTSAITAHCEGSFLVYQELLARGVPRELARGVLPVNAYSRMFATVDLHNLFHFLELRLYEHAQYEIRVYAEALLQLIRDVVPLSVKAFEKKLGL